MFNRYQAVCVECGAVVPPGKGVVIDTAPKGKPPAWIVKCNKHIDWNRIPKIYRPKEDDHGR